jgi:predicted XRE-type DNA-binding protein
MADEQDARVGSGDFIRDRGHPDPEDFRLRARVAAEIALLVEDRGMSIEDIARATGLTAPEAERLAQAVVRGMTLKRLEDLHERLKEYVKCGR